jgi:hypothetical protein
VWADTLLRAEQQHALRMLLWAAGSVVAGTALAVILARQRADSPLLKHFGLQMLAWGFLDAAVVAFMWRGLVLRDLAGATRLERELWLTLGVEAGIVAVGITLAASAWTFGRRLGGVGAGIGVIIQGLALLALDLDLVSKIVR